MRFIIVTGISGAGKTTSLKHLEDIGYFCVDNLPVELIPKFAELSKSAQYSTKDIALGIDIRNGKSIEKMQGSLDELSEMGLNFEILYVDADDEQIIKRYKETRRKHPLAAKGDIADGIAKERQHLSFLLEKADYLINTSKLLTRDLKKELENIFLRNKDFKNLFVTVMSFGFKYGIPGDADLVFDVRFMPNPYYIDELKEHTGEEACVSDYVLSHKVTQEFLAKLIDMTQFLIPSYIDEGKSQLVIAIGCTGGKHRSVTVANKLYEALSENADFGIKKLHRDIDKGKN